MLMATMVHTSRQSLLEGIYDLRYIVVPFLSATLNSWQKPKRSQGEHATKLLTSLTFQIAKCFSNQSTLSHLNESITLECV